MNTYYFEIPANVLDYNRKILGMRPYDEVAPVIEMFERGRAEQDKQRQDRVYSTGNGHDKAEEQRACN